MLDGSDDEDFQAPNEMLDDATFAAAFDLPNTHKVTITLWRHDSVTP
jgi:hypothetical protein